MFLWLVWVAPRSRNKRFCIFTIWLLISICLLCIRYYYSFTLPSFFCFLVPDWFNFDPIKCCFVCLFWRTIEFAKLNLSFLRLCWFLDSADVGYSSPLSFFAFSCAAPSLFVLFWLENLLLFLSLLTLYASERFLD